MGAELATLLGKTLVYFPLSVELICAVSLLPHILYTCSSHISYPHRLLCGGLGQVCKCRSSPSSNVSIWFSFSVCICLYVTYHHSIPYQLHRFASPRVGASSFLHANQHMERIGRIRHARFSNNQDLVPMVQLTNFQGANPFRWQFYKHVGLRIQLHGNGRLAKRSLRQALDVTYPLHHDWLSELRRMVVTNNVISNLTTPAGYRKNHTLTEYQRRIHFTSQYRMALAKSSEFDLSIVCAYLSYSHLVCTFISYRIILFSSLLS